MRKLFLLVALAGFATAQATEMGDTLVIRDARSVTIVTNDSLQKIKVNGKESDANYVYENTIQLVDSNYVDERRIYRDLKALEFPLNKKNSNYRTIDIYGTAHAGLGFPTGISSEKDVSFSTFKSFEAFVTLFQLEMTKKKSLQTYSVGFMLDWRQYRFGTNQMLMKNAAENVVLTDFPEGVSSRSTGVNIFSLSVPVLFRQRFGHNSKISFSLGPVVNFNVHGSLTNKYKMGDNEYDITTRHIGYRPITVDVMGVLNLNWIGLYVKYSPMSVFKDWRGPKFQSISFGIYL